MCGLVGTVQQASVRQCVSFAIVVVTIASIFVLKYLVDAGQRTQLCGPISSQDIYTNADSIGKSQPNVQSKHGALVKEKCQTEDTALKFRREELGFSSSDTIRSNFKDGVHEPPDTSLEIESRTATLIKSRNPCWRSNRTRLGLACLPYFYLAGFPRCGTTDLYWRLGQHPHIVRSKFKELPWITKGHLIRPENEGLYHYEESFAKALLRRWTSRRDMLNAIIGDCSSSTMSDNSHWRQLPGNVNCSEPRVITADIVRYLNPAARIVVIVRNPADRLYSEYLFSRQTASKERFHDLVLKTTHQASDCFKQNTVRRCAYHALNEAALRVHVGLYHIYIEDWLLRFPREKLHVLRLEDLAANRTKELGSLCEFLGVDHQDEKIIGAMLKGPVANQGQQAQQLGPMLKETRDVLNEFYYPFNERLAKVLKDDKYKWS